MNALDLWEEGIELPHGYRWKWYSALDLMRGVFERNDEEEEEEEGEEEQT